MHHGRNDYHSESLPSLSDEFVEQGKKLETVSRLGPTGRFPEGKLTDSDEGEIAFGVTHDQGKVILDFGTPVQWVGMSPAQAKELARSLEKHALKAR